MIFIDGLKVAAEKGRDSSVWYTHPKTMNACMRVSRIVEFGYISNKGLISKCNTIQQQLASQLKKQDLDINITYVSNGRSWRTHAPIVKFTFSVQERDNTWGEQRLQEALDEILTLSI